jgi:geranylgeranyl diphosphate synthase, type II
VELAGFKERYRPLLAAVMHEQLACISVPELRAAMDHLAGRGKLFRPLLVLAACHAAGGGDPQRWLRLATPLELLHTFTLIHDDLPCMDDAQLRRGVPAVHIAHSEALAVLAGDALLGHGLYLLATEPPELPPGVRCQLVATLSHANQLVAEGQVLDLLGEGCDLSLAELQRLHRRKTGALLGACCACGGLLAGLTGAAVARLWDVGELMGLAFQVRDDLLSLESTEAEMGKTLSTDVEKVKATYPRALGLDGAKRHLAELLARLEQDILALKLLEPGLLLAQAREAGERAN